MILVTVRLYHETTQPTSKMFPLFCRLLYFNRDRRNFEKLQNTAGATTTAFEWSLKQFTRLGGIGPHGPLGHATKRPRVYSVTSPREQAVLSRPRDLKGLKRIIGRASLWFVI